MSGTCPDCGHDCICRDHRDDCAEIQCSAKELAVPGHGDCDCHVSAVIHPTITAIRAALEPAQ